MVRQELKPVRPSCWFGVDFIIFEDKEVTAALNKNVNLFFSSSKTYSFPCGGWKRINNQVEMELVCWNTNSRGVSHGSKLTAIYIMQLKFINIRNNLFEVRKFKLLAFILAVSSALIDNLKEEQTINKYGENFLSSSKVNSNSCQRP